MASKWNFSTHHHEPYDLPKGASLRESHLSDTIQCAQCGKEFEYGDSYTSKQIFTDELGFGYCVCVDCYSKEWEEKKASSADTDESH